MEEEGRKEGEGIGRGGKDHLLKKMTRAAGHCSDRC